MLKGQYALSMHYVNGLFKSRIHFALDYGILVFRVW